MQTYCLKCKKDTKNVESKIEQKIIDYLCNQNVVIVKIKNQDL